MTRRRLLAIIASLPVVGFVAQQRPAPARTIVGPMTLERERMLASRGVKVSVFVDDVDVTNRCQFADDTPGHECARLLKHGPDGRPYYDRSIDEVARETVTSGVRITLERKRG